MIEKGVGQIVNVKHLTHTEGGYLTPTNCLHSHFFTTSSKFEFHTGSPRCYQVENIRADFRDAQGTEQMSEEWGGVWLSHTDVKEEPSWLCERLECSISLCEMDKWRLRPCVFTADDYKDTQMSMSLDSPHGWRANVLQASTWIYLQLWHADEENTAFCNVNVHDSLAYGRGKTLTLCSK